HPFNNLAPGTTYPLTVPPTHAAGTGPGATTHASITATTPPAPTNLTVTKNDSARTATIATAPPSSDGGSPITGYRVA
ncbi:hypothetical protein, partial [Vibrio parahaemolyticus]|uniref:hypothetical protein n=1 Tax=Vibrio parahaemolyticus TaxID=670 RepID=UPI002111D73F